MPRRYMVVAYLAGEVYPVTDPLPWPAAVLQLHRARFKDFSRAVGVLLRTGYECYPVVFKLSEVPVAFVSA